MALRYGLHPRTPDLYPSEKVLPARLAKHPVAVDHNRDKDPRQTAREILRNAVTDLHAAVGAGKSTLIPRALAAESNILVFMIVPSQLLATQLYDYAIANPVLANDGVTSYLCEDIDKELPSSGVVYVGGAIMVSLLLRRGWSQMIANKIIFLDEAHESDTFSYVLRNLGVQMGAKHLVRASATLCIDSVKVPRNPSAQIVEGGYDKTESPETWDLSDATKPWYYRQDGNTLVFTDSETDAEVLRRKYDAYGYEVYRLTSRTSVEDFRVAVAALEGKYAVLLIVDYSFRSGFTFNVTNVIDIGLVYYMSGKTGRSEKLCRNMYEFEMVQARGRVGRVKGLTARYSRPTGKLEKCRTDLEGVEAEAAAYLFRLLGFKPSHELAGKVMATMFLPANVKLLDAMNGKKPLTCYDLLTEMPERRSEVAETQAAGFDSPAISTPIVPKPPQTTERVAEVKNPTTVAEDPWEMLVDGYRTRGDPRLEEGVAYYATHIPMGIEQAGSSIFPDGADSVIEFAMANPNRRNLWTMLAEDERLYAVAVMLRKYNQLLIEAKAMRIGLSEAVKELRPETQSTYVRRSVAQAASEVRQIEIHRRDAFRIMCRFLSYSGELAAHDFPGAVIASKATDYAEKFGSVICGGQRCDIDQYFASYDTDYGKLLPETVRNLRFDEVDTRNHNRVGRVKYAPPPAIVWSRALDQPVRYAAHDYSQLRIGGKPTFGQLEDYVNRRNSASSSSTSSDSGHSLKGG